MKKILYIPLDERPCNNLIPQMLVKPQADKIELLSVPGAYLGLKKVAAQTAEINKWFVTEAKNVDAAVISIEMLIYGGLVPSRLHNFTLEEGLAKLKSLEEAKIANPNLIIYASNLIMRTPKYSSDDEEPEYYGIYGSEIFKRSYLSDKEARVGISESEKEELLVLEKAIPKEHLADYENRRAYNQKITEAVMGYVKSGVIDYLVIPQDDSAEFGYTALDQKSVRKLLEVEDLELQVSIYPGADEVGATLLARAYCRMFKLNLSFFPIFPSVNSQTLIPMYEDRPLGESMKSHIFAAGATLAFSAEESDIILGYNTAGLVMQEAWDQQEQQDITYISNRNVPVFMQQLLHFHQKGKKIAIADSAYANGGDLSLIKALDQCHLLEEILSYKGWNTNCNTLGTTLAAAIFAYNSNEKDVIIENTIYHLVDDVFYQAVVRNKVSKTVLPEYGANYFDISMQKDAILAIIEREVLNAYTKYCKVSFQTKQIEALNSYSPWERMFEIGYNIVFKK